MICSQCGYSLSMFDKACPRCSGAAHSGEPGVAGALWKVGDRVLAHWKPEAYWYPATVTQVSPASFYVVFDDGDEQWTEPEGVTAENLGAGSRIFANWKHQGKYYPGVIQTRQGNMITIDYDDGDRETTTISVVRVPR